MSVPFDLTWHPAAWNLAAPLSWPSPARVSVEDLFRKTSNEDIAAVFGVMAACPQHTFAISTEHPERMREWFASLPAGGLIWSRLLNGIQQLDAYRPALRRAFESSLDARAGELTWPLPNVHLGVRITDQRTADERIPVLLDTPAAVRFVEVVPEGAIDLTNVCTESNESSAEYLNALSLEEWSEEEAREEFGDRFLRPLNWVLVSGPTGRAAPPCDVAWIRSIVTQCRAASVPVFVRGDDLPDDLRVRELPQ